MLAMLIIICGLAQAICALSIRDLNHAADPVDLKAKPAGISAGLPTDGSVPKTNVIHGQIVTQICFEAYRASFVKTLAVTDVVQTLVKSTNTVPSLKIPGLAAARSALVAQQVYTKLNQQMDVPLTDDDRATILQARNEEVSVSVFISLVINNMQYLNAAQKEMLDKFHVVAQAERVGRLLVQQSCPELEAQASPER